MEQRITQKEIIRKFDGEIDQACISRVLNGLEQVSWFMASKLSDLFPGKSIKEWRKATGEEVARAFGYKLKPIK